MKKRQKLGQKGLTLSYCIGMLSDMNQNNFQLKIEEIKKKIAGLGALRPGSLYERHSVCGKAGCRCSREKRPVKHGPYYYLSYTFKGKSYTEFVPAEQVKNVKKQIRNYDRLMKLVKTLVEFNIRLARLQRRR